MNLSGVTREQLSRLDEETLHALAWRAQWLKTARPNQIPPPGKWTVCGFLAGRGWGKSFCGGHWITWEAWTNPGMTCHVIAPTYDDVARVCFDGPSGILSHLPPALIDGEFNKSDLILKLKNGSVIRGFSAEKPNRLRGPQAARLWADELAAWQYADEAWDMAMMGLRLGDHTRAVFTTTPRPTPLIRDFVNKSEQEAKKADPTVLIVRGSTYENRANLSKNFFDDLLTKYEGTALGRQELDAEILDPEEQGIIRRSWLNLWPAKKPLPVFEFIVVSLDTAFTEATRDKKTGDPDPTACAVWGLFRENGRDGVLLLECWSELAGMPDLLKRVPLEMAQAYGDQDEPLLKPLYGAPLLGPRQGRKPDLLLIEDKGSGISLRQMLEREGIHAYAYNPGRAKKVERLHAVSHLFANGLIWVPESENREGTPKTWAEPLISQLCSFNGEGSVRHDDFVDATTQALRLIVDRNMISVANPRTMDLPEQDYRPRTNPYAA